MRVISFFQLLSDQSLHPNAGDPLFRLLRKVRIAHETDKFSLQGAVVQICVKVDLSAGIVLHFQEEEAPRKAAQDPLSIQFQIHSDVAGEDQLNQILRLRLRQSCLALGQNLQHGILSGQLHLDLHQLPLGKGQKVALDHPLLNIEEDKALGTALIKASALQATTIAVDS